MSQSRKHVYRFGPFSLNHAERILMREGRRVQAEPKTVDTLIAFIERRGEVLTKEELRMAIWGPSTFVEPNTVERQVSVLRKLLRAASNEDVFIETIPKRGYRFVKPVVEMSATTPARQSGSSEANPGNHTSLAAQVVSRVLPIGLVFAMGLFLSWKYLVQVLIAR